MISERLSKLLIQDLDLRQYTINLNASENFTSNTVKNIIKNPCYDNYSFPPYGGVIEGIWRFSGSPYDAISEYISELCFELLNTKEVDPRPKGGQAAEIGVLLSLAKSGDKVFYISEKDGGHVGLEYIAHKCGIQLQPLLFNQDTHTLLIDENVEQMKKIWKPSDKKSVILCQSYMLKAQPYSVFSQAVKTQFKDCILSCDVSHPLGLIVGGQFPNPLLCGFDILHASTHKTFPGPQKAIIGLHKDSEFSIGDLRYAISPGLQSNCGTSEIFALAVALEEMKHFGHLYAKKVCRNAKYFAKSLAQLGLSVIGEDFGFTNTHQVWILIGDEVDAWKAASTLNIAGIRAFPSYLPYTNGAYGLRLGVNAMTRRGLGIEEFEQIAQWIKVVLFKHHSAVAIKKAVKDLLKNYPMDQFKYSFDNKISSHSNSELIV